MTRVTANLRDELEHTIMKNLPSRNFAAEMHDLVQAEIIAAAPTQVQELYNNPETRDLLRQSYLEVRKGNRNVSLCGFDWDKERRTEYVYGLSGNLTIRVDDIDHEHRIEDRLYKTIVTKLVASGLVDDYFAQNDLRDTVRKRLRANLYAAKTIKQLYQTLEPELHHYIPKDEEKALLPSCVAPVVDDLRKLGANLPVVPKAVAS